MSSERASYALQQEQLARLAEQARLAALRRRLGVASARRARLRRRADLVARRGGPVVTVPMLVADPTDAELETATGFAEAGNAGLEADLDAAEREARDRWTTAQVAAVLAAARPVPAAATVEPAPDRADDEVARVLARLAADAEPSGDLDLLVAALGDAGTRRNVLLVQLRAEVSARNAAAAARRAAVEAIDDARVIAEQTGDGTLCALVSLAAAEIAAGRPVDVTGLRTAAKAAVRRQSEDAERRFVLDSVVAAFAALDYEVLPGADLLTAHEGVLVHGDSAGSARAVHVAVATTGITVSPSHVAGTTPATEAEARAADAATCRDTEQMWRALQDAGIDIGGPVVRLTAQAPVESGVAARASGPSAGRRRPAPRRRQRHL